MAIQRLPAVIGILAAAMLGSLLSACTEEPEGPPRVVVIGPAPKMAVSPRRAIFVRQRRRTCRTMATSSACSGQSVARRSMWTPFIPSLG